MKRWVLLAAVALLLGCREETASTRLPSREAVMAVGPFVLATLPSEGSYAPEAVIHDFLFGAERRGTNPESLASAERRVLARMVLEDLKAGLREVSSEERRLARERLWFEVNRPPGVRALAAHCPVGVLEDDATPELVAEDILRATKEDAAPQDFVRHSREVNARGIELQLHLLPAFTKEGRLLPFSDDASDLPNPPAQVIEAVTVLEKPGDKSSIVRAPDGFWVLYVLETTPPLVRTDPEAEKLVEENARESALRLRLDALVQEARTGWSRRDSPRLGELLQLAWNNQ